MGQRGGGDATSRAEVRETVGADDVFETDAARGGAGEAWAEAGRASVYVTVGFDLGTAGDAPRVGWADAGAGVATGVFAGGGGAAGLAAV
jgi:hypothetical protein